MPLSTLAIAAAALSACLHLRAEARGPRWQVYVFKPLTTALLLLLAALAPSAHGTRYQAAVSAGLLCSLLGDVFLMLPRDRFVAGLASFLLAHLAYLVAFSSGTRFGTAPGLALPLLAAVALVLWRLWPALGKYRLPVVLYAAAIALMVWQAWSRSRALPGSGAALAAAGATLFLLSDTVLALDRFARPFPWAGVLTMSSYVAAQAMIALSVSTP